MDVNTKRTELANELAAAGAALLDFNCAACAIAAIPDTEPQQDVAAGTPEHITKLLPATIDPQRRQKHGDRPSADALEWDEADSRATAIDIDKLEALALKLGNEEWTSDVESGVVFGADGDSVCLCHANAGAMPEFIYPGDRSDFIAAANPAAVLDLIALARRAEPEGLRTALAEVTAKLEREAAENLSLNMANIDLREQLARRATASGDDLPELPKGWSQYVARAYVTWRKHDHETPDDILDLMRDILYAAGSRRATAPHAGIDVPADFIDFWQLMVEHGQFDGAHGYGVFYERHAKSLHKALLAAQPVEAADPLEQKLPCEITIGTMRLTTNDNLRTLVKVAQLIHQHARENGERLSALGALPVEADCAQVAMGEPSEISARLRERATGAMANQNDARLMLAAADECDRFYGGMMAWKRTAEKKDRDYNEARMRFENYKCGQRATESAAAPADLSKLEKLGNEHRNAWHGAKGIAPGCAWGQLTNDDKIHWIGEAIRAQPTTQAEGK